MLELFAHGVGLYSPGGLIGPARWTHHDLIVIVEGTVDFSVEGSTIASRAGDAVLIPPGFSFRGEAGDDGASIWVQHFACRGKAAQDWLTLPPAPTRWVGVGQWEWPRTLMRRLLRLQNSAESTSDKICGLLLVLLIEEFKTAKSLEREELTASERTVQQIIEQIENHNLPLPSLKEIAEFAGWSVSYFRDQFRSVSGRSIGDFLKQRRMGEAARLLAETRLPIKEISAQAGYSEVAAFHRAFQIRYKVTPGQYRDQCVPMV